MTKSRTTKVVKTTEQPLPQTKSGHTSSRELTTQDNKENLLKALEMSLGIVSTACNKAGVSRVTFYDYMNNDPSFRERVLDLQELALDFAESAILKRIQEGSDAAIIFYLKTKGKRRGFIERQEIDTDPKKEEGRPHWKMPDGTTIEL